jgi:hypothetical protein
MTIDTINFTNDQFERNESVFCSWKYNATMLDIDFLDVPYVTNGNRPTAMWRPVRCMESAQDCAGFTEPSKAYCTRSW